LLVIFLFLGIGIGFLRILIISSTSNDSEIIFEIFSSLFFKILLSYVEINPRCLDSKFKIGFFGITPIIGNFVFSKASLQRISCYLLPILFKIIPTILEFL